MAQAESGMRDAAVHTRPAVLAMIDPRSGEHRLVDADAPQLRVTDLAALRGDGVFETLLAVNGRGRKIEAHLARLRASALMADLTLPEPKAWREAIASALAAHGDVPEALVKLMASRGLEGGTHATAWVHVSDCTGLYDTARTKGIDVVTLDRGYDSRLGERAPWLLIGAKTLSYAVNMAALREARMRGADDVIFLSSDDLLLEGPTSTVLLAMHADDPARRTLLTVAPACGVLAGTTQAALFSLAADAGWQTRYDKVPQASLSKADALWLISSGRLLAPVNRVDGRLMPRRPDLDAELNSLIRRIE